MSKQEFLALLRKGLSGLPRDDMEERLTFYSEMIDDRMEEGLSEEAAVGEIGDIEELIAQITAELPAPKTAAPKKGRNAWEIVLLVLGAPLWLPLLIAALIIILSLFIVALAVIISLWAVFVSLVGCALVGVAAGLVFAFIHSVFTGLAMIAAGIVCAGLSILTFYGCKVITKGIWRLTKRLFTRRKRNE